MQFRFDDFSASVGQLFTLDFEGAAYPLTLIAADRLTNTATVGDREAFSLVFRGQSSPVLDQRIYRISNDMLGEMELFIVPIGPDGEGMRYEAVFS